MKTRTKEKEKEEVKIPSDERAASTAVPNSSTRSYAINRRQHRSQVLMEVIQDIHQDDGFRSGDVFSSD